MTLWEKSWECVWIPYIPDTGPSMPFHAHVFTHVCPATLIYPALPGEVRLIIHISYLLRSQGYPLLSFHLHRMNHLTKLALGQFMEMEKIGAPLEGPGQRDLQFHKYNWPFVFLFPLGGKVCEIRNLAFVIFNAQDQHKAMCTDHPQ